MHSISFFAYVFKNYLAPLVIPFSSTRPQILLEDMNFCENEVQGSVLFCHSGSNSHYHLCPSLLAIKDVLESHCTVYYGLPVGKFVSGKVSALPEEDSYQTLAQK